MKGRTLSRPSSRQYFKQLNSKWNNRVLKSIYDMYFIKIPIYKYGLFVISKPLLLIRKSLAMLLLNKNIYI